MLLLQNHGRHPLVPGQVWQAQHQVPHHHPHQPRAQVDQRSGKFSTDPANRLVLTYQGPGHHPHPLGHPGVAFKTAFKNPFISTVMKGLLEMENMDNLATACQGLTRPEWLLQLLDPDTLDKVAKSHPSLLEAAKNLSAAVHEEQQSAGRTGALGCASWGWGELLLG